MWAHILKGLWRPGDQVLASADGVRWDDVSDEGIRHALDVMERLERIRCSAHRIPQDEGYTPWQEDDSALGNTTVGAGFIPNTRFLQMTLRETNASAAEVRTLPDPVKSFTNLALTLTARNGQNLVVRCSTPVWIGATVTQPAITQNGQFITFSSTNHSIQLSSVPCTKTSFVGTQSTFVNTSGFRWMVLNTDGPTVT